MTEFKGTPGPWEKGAIIGRYVDGRHKWTHICTAQDDDIDSQEYEANINLISAAPDLLEALIGSIKEMEGLYKGIAPNGDFANQSQAVITARAAVAKAIGKPNA